MTNKRTIVFRHVLVWNLYITYELLIIKMSVGLITSPIHLAAYYLLNIFLFYFNAHVILDFAFFKTNRPYLVASSFICLEILVFLFLKLKLDAFLNVRLAFSLAITFSNEKLWLNNIFREIFFIGFSIAYWSMLYMIKFKERNHIMEREQLRALAKNLELENKYISAENAYLQNQISPHLLFNSLNFIYNSIHRLSEKAGKSVMLLSDIMRYSLVSSIDDRTVLLKEELAQIEKLIELSHLRFDQQLFINFRKKGLLKEARILPLILITFVENMIKHGDLGEPGDPGRILLEVINKELKFTTVNRKRESSPHPPSGIGLQNVEKRLANHYPDRYQLAVQDEPEHYYITLTLTL